MVPPDLEERVQTELGALGVAPEKVKLLKAQLADHGKIELLNTLPAEKRRELVAAMLDVESLPPDRRARAERLVATMVSALEPARVIPKQATVIVVGAGPAGLGTAGLLKQCGIDVVVLERGEVGQTFKAWPKETRFISPSFTGNFFNVPDLNAITPESSPAFTLQTQHPTGDQYAKYLAEMKNHMDVDVVTGTNVTDIAVEKHERELKPKVKSAEACKEYNQKSNESVVTTLEELSDDDDGGGGVDDGSLKRKQPLGDGSLQQQLCDAAHAGKVADVQVLLGKRGADPTKPGVDPTKLPMYFAASAGHVDVVALLLKFLRPASLLKNGPDVQVAIVDRGVTALFVAAQMGHVAVAEMLLKNDASINRVTTDNGRSPLYVASQEGHLEMVAMLLKSNADPKLADTEDGRTPLWMASANGHATVVAELLLKGADPNQATTGDGSSPLFISAAFGHDDVVTTLLQHSDTDPNQKTLAAAGAAPPLYIAAEGGFAKVVATILQDPRANPNTAAGDGATALFCAATFGNVGVVAALLKHRNTDPNRPDNDGRSPLGMAAREGHKDVVAILLEQRIHGAVSADPSRKDRGGFTALAIAEHFGHTAIADMIRACGTGGGDNPQTAGDPGDAVPDTADSRDFWMSEQEANRKQLPDITLKTSGGDYTAKFVVWAGGEFQYPKSIPHTVRVGHGTGYSAYADLPRGHHVVIGGGESGIDISHFLVGLGDSVTILDASAPWNSRESDSSLGLSPYTFDRLHKLQASGKVTFIAERAESITETEVTTKSHTLKLTNPAIDATGFDISKSIAGKLFKFEDGVPQITQFDESTICRNVFLVGPHVQHSGAVFCFIYKYRQRFAVLAKQMMHRLGMEGAAPLIEEYAKKNFLLEDLTDCGKACPC